MAPKSTHWGSFTQNPNFPTHTTLPPFPSPHPQLYLMLSSPTTLILTTNYPSNSLNSALMLPSSKTLILTINYPSNSPNSTLIFPSPKSLILTANYPSNSPSIRYIICITQTLSLTTNNPQTAPKFAQGFPSPHALKFHWCTPIHPAKSRVQVNLIQVDATTVETLNMLLNISFWGGGGVGFRINLAPFLKDQLFLLNHCFLPLRPLPSS